MEDKNNKKPSTIEKISFLTSCIALGTSILALIIKLMK